MTLTRPGVSLKIFQWIDNCKILHARFLILNWIKKETASLRMNLIKGNIDGIKKTHMGGNHLHIFAVLIVFQTYIFVHIRHYRDEVYPLCGVCYHPYNFDDLVKLLGGNEKGTQMYGNISGKRSIKIELQSNLKFPRQWKIQKARSH